MKVIDAGHHYQLQNLDDKGFTDLVFVKREGENFPGNVGSNPGPTSQEVIRALLNRAHYVDNQKSFEENESVINALRLALFFLEVRAKRVRGETLSFGIDDAERIEYLPACKTCGHIECTLHK